MLLCGLVLLIYINPDLHDKIQHYLSSVLVSSEIWILLFVTMLILSAFLAYLHPLVKKQVFTSFYYLKTSSNLFAKILFFSLMAWLFEFVAIAIIAFGLAIPNVLVGAWGSMILGTLAAMLPVSGYFGTFDFFALLGLMSAGADAQAGGGFLVLIRLVIWLPITITGFVLLTINYTEITTLLRRSKFND